MAEARQLLAALRHGDSFFPSGAASFSWGLETLRAEGRVVSEADVHAFVVGQLRHRWATAERPALAAAHRARGDLDAVAAVDGEVEALALAREMREGSRRSGGALLQVHAALGTPGAADYRRRVASGAAFGHAPVVQGLVWGAAGLDEDGAAIVSAHGLSVALLGAALRLGLVGHVACQRILAQLHETIAPLLAEAPPPMRRCRAFTPAAEIAMMRHETGGARLFAN